MNTKKIYGVVTDCLPNLQYRVKTEEEVFIRCYMSGKMKLHKISIIAGDKVEIEVPEILGCDRLENYIGRIIFRLK